MKANLSLNRGSKPKKLTLAGARRAARLARGDDPPGKMFSLTSPRGRELREKYLGEIVPGLTRSKPVGRVSESRHAGVKKFVAKKVAKKK
jgi:hypothetical protein